MSKTVKIEAPADAPAVNLIAPNATRSANSHAVLNYLARIWPNSATRAELAAVFTEADDNKDACSPLCKRINAALANMVKTGYATSQGSGQDRKFALGPAAQIVKPMEPQPEPTPEPDLPEYVGTPAPARQPDVMTSPHYCPKPMQALRPGSGDFTRLPSLRQGQRLPFTGGYVVAGSKA